MGLTRAEFFSRIGLTRMVDPMVNDAYKFTESLEAQRRDRGADHAHDWHTGFHGSEFPGDYEFACGRKAMYGLMDVPREKPNRWLRMLADMGKDHEVQLVKRWYNAGMLVSAPPVEDAHQTQFEDPEHFLSSTVDAIILHPRSNMPVVSEEKMKFAKEIERMRGLIRGPDDAHIRQVKCQVGMAHEAGPQRRLRCFNTGRLAVEMLFFDTGVERFDEFVCPQHLHADCLEEVELDAVRYGYIYYSSRDDPMNTWEFFYEHDPKFMEEGRKQLAKWRDSFLAGDLPQTSFKDKRFSHPFDWYWSKIEYPCKWCDYGDACRLDHKKAVEQQKPIKLSESAAIGETRHDYDYEEVKRLVLERWGFSEDGSPP